MPGFNGRGPTGKGSMTGGCRGFCVLPASRYSMVELNQTEELSSLKYWAATLQRRLLCLDERGKEKIQGVESEEGR